MHLFINFILIRLRLKGIIEIKNVLRKAWQQRVSLALDALVGTPGLLLCQNGVKRL